MPRQEDLAYVEYEFIAKGFECFYEPFERDRPDMIAIDEEKIIIVELLWMKERKEEMYKKISKRKVEFLLIIPKLKPDIKEKLEKEGIKVLLRPIPS